MLNNLVKIKLKRANSRIKFVSQEFKNMIKYMKSLLTFSYVIFSEFLAK